VWDRHSSTGVATPIAVCAGLGRRDLGGPAQYPDCDKKGELSTTVRSEKFKHVIDSKTCQHDSNSKERSGNACGSRKLCNIISGDACGYRDFPIQRFRVGFYCRLSGEICSVNYSNL
jgi:hypothetical protein